MTPHGWSQVLGAPWHDGDVEDRMVGVFLQLADDEDIPVLEDDPLAGLGLLEAPLFPTVHPAVPVREHVRRELGGQLDHAHGKVEVVEELVVGYAPHDDEMDVLGPQLPGHGAGRAGDGVQLVGGHDELPMGWQDVPLHEPLPEASVQGVASGVGQEPFGPVFYLYDAPDLVALVVIDDVGQGGFVGVGMPVLN